jgi:uncharacterized protein YndB with AHSA1/START domain
LESLTVPERTTSHASFTIERRLAHPAARVFRAFADQRAKARWFLAPREWATAHHRFDFRIGGSEHLESVPPGGPTITFDATYLDIVPARRIIYSYAMVMGEERISTSLAAIELTGSATETVLTVTEHGIFLDGLDEVGRRERGTHALLDQLTESLDLDGDGPVPSATWTD